MSKIRIGSNVYDSETLEFYDSGRIDLKEGRALNERSDGTYEKFQTILDRNALGMDPKVVKLINSIEDAAKEIQGLVMTIQSVGAKGNMDVPAFARAAAESMHNLADKLQNADGVLRGIAIPPLFSDDGTDAGILKV